MTTLRFEQKPEAAMSQLGLFMTSGECRLAVIECFRDDGKVWPAICGLKKEKHLPRDPPRSQGGG